MKTRERTLPIEDSKSAVRRDRLMTVKCIEKDARMP
jgi:hypothetical protein